MSISLTGVEVRHGYGIRLLFSNALDAGAFGILPTLYAVEPLDGRGAPTLVKAALAVPGQALNVELVLGTELVHDAPYKVTAVGVPATDLSVTPAGSELPFVWGSNQKKANVEAVVSNRDLLLYKIDLVWNQVDFQEAPNRDLARAGGRQNVTKALYRGLHANGRAWDDTYGAKLGEDVDSPSSTVGTVRGKVIAQVLRDPRVQKAKVDFEIKGSDTYVVVTPTLVSGEAAERVTITVPNG